mgnify:CR=1 FL=1
MRIDKKNKSFTLPEILVAFSIFTLLTIGVFQVMSVGKNFWFTGDISMELRQEIIKTFMKMENELRKTRPAQITLGSGTSSSMLTFRIPNDNNGNGTILDASGNVEWSNPITYALNDANQITRTTSGSTTILANNIISLQFTRPMTPLNLLQIDIVVGKKAATNRQLEDVGQIMITMRN